MAAGAPTKYKQEFAEQAQKLCELGATDMQLADFFKVVISTIYLWKITHQEFSDALKLGKEKPNNNVVRSLYNRAMGYSHEDVDIRVIDNQIIKTPIIKHYPPDSTSIIFFLKNRLPEEFRQNPNAETGDNDLAEALLLLAKQLPK